MPGPYPKAVWVCARCKAQATVEYAANSMPPVPQGWANETAGGITMLLCAACRASLALAMSNWMKGIEGGSQTKT